MDGRPIGEGRDRRRSGEHAATTPIRRVQVRRQAARQLAILVLALGLWHGASQRARADEPWLVDGEFSLGLPVTAPQRDWFGVGGSLAIGVQRPLTPWFALAARLRTAGFLNGDAPDNPGVKD